MLSQTVIGPPMEQRRTRVVDDAVGRCGAGWATLARRLSGEPDPFDDRLAGTATTRAALAR